MDISRDDREVKNSPIIQGYRESTPYVFDWGEMGTPSSPSVTLYDPECTDKTSTQISGSSSVVGNKVLTGQVSFSSGDIGKVFRLDCDATVGGATRTLYTRIVVGR